MTAIIVTILALGVLFLIFSAVVVLAISWCHGSGGKRKK